MAAEKELLHGIALMKEGKEEGFNILYSHTYNYVYGRARSIMKTESDAQDLTQETFIQAYKGIATLEDANNVYAWLGGIVFRQGAKLYNKTKKELLLNEDQDYIFDEVETKDVDALPEESAELKATSDVVMSMIEELPELQRSAIVSFYYDHMKIEEIAKVFECSVNTIKSRLNYAKKFLKSKVEEHQKQYSYKLFSFSPAVLLLALRGLLTSEKYTMAPESAEKVYHVACDALGITASTVAVGAVATAVSSSAAAGAGATGAAAGTAATAGAAGIEGAATIGAASAASAAGTAVTTTATAAKTGGFLGKFLALSAAKKTGAVVLATAVIGGGTTTAVLVSNHNPEPPAIVQEVVDDEPELTMTPVPTATIAPTATSAPTVTPEPTVTPSLAQFPSGNYVYTEEEYYTYLAEQAKAGVEKTQVYCYNATYVLNNVPKLQQYAGINVSLQAVSSDWQPVEYICTHGHTHTATFDPVEVSFTYGDTEIAAYTEEDYWNKVEKAVAKRLDSFTIYFMAEESTDAIERIWFKYSNHIYPDKDFLAGSVCYFTETSIDGFFAQYYQGAQTYHFAYLDSNDIRINHANDIRPTISAWYEGSREPGVTFYIPVTAPRYNNPTCLTDDSSALRDWFYTKYPDSEYSMEFGYFTGSDDQAPLYYTCTLKKPGEPDPTPEVLPSIDASISLAPIATPMPTPTPGITLAKDDVIPYAKQILSEILTPEMSELEKVKAIHDYMILHIDPDEFASLFDMVQTEHTTVYHTLSTGSAPCAGYASTFYQLCILAGLEVTSVPGHASHCWNHTWNQVKVDGNWYNIDICADENMTSVTKDFDDHSNATYRYFLVSDYDLGYTVEPNTPVCHPCTTDSIAFHALEYGCPWGFHAYCSSEEELRQLAYRASAQGLTHMKVILNPDWQFSLSENLALLYEEISKNHYATELTYSQRTVQIMGGQTYVSYDIWFRSEAGIPVTYPYADTVEAVHDLVTQSIAERKREIALYAPSLDFVRSAIQSYSLPDNYYALYVNPHYNATLRNIDTLILISLYPENPFSFPN